MNTDRTSMEEKTPRESCTDPDNQYSRLVRAYRRLCGGLQVFSIQWSCFTFFMIANVTKSIRIVYTYILTDESIGTIVHCTHEPIGTKKQTLCKLSAVTFATTYAFGMILLIIKYASISQTHARISMVLKYALPWGKYDNNDVTTIESIQTKRGALNVSIVGTTFQITPFFSYALVLPFVAIVSCWLKVAGFIDSND